MCAMFKKKPTLLDQRMKQIRQEISLVKGELRNLSKVIENPEKAPVLPKPITPEDATVKPLARSDQLEFRAIPASGPKHSLPEDHPNKVYEQRFADYLASSFQTVQILRREKQSQRNRAIIWILAACLALCWMISRFLL